MNFGVYSYLISIVIFAGAAVALEWVFGFHLLKKYLKPLVITVIFYLFFPITEAVALKWENWDYSTTNTLHTRILGAEIETYVFTIFVAVAVASAVIAWTFYEDKGKPIMLEALKDVFKGTYAIWRRKKNL